jgi:hypothetical protein
MSYEDKLDTEKFDANFRAMIFASDQNLYFEMFDKAKERKEIEEGVEWIVPRSEAEVEELVRQIDQFEAELETGTSSP